MMTRMNTGMVGGGTPADLVWAAALGARIATRKRRCLGLDDDVIRNEVISSFKDDLDADDFGEFARETLMVAVQRAVDEALAEPSW
jgi:hypothetical protein